MSDFAVALLLHDQGTHTGTLPGLLHNNLLPAGLVQAALNLVSVAKMGFYGSQQEKLWCTSNVESLHLWEWAAACEENAPGQSSCCLCHAAVHASSQPLS